VHYRGNYLFAGSDGCGESAAIIYSLIGTARLNDVDDIVIYLQSNSPLLHDG